MANEDATDNIMNSRSVVAPNSTTHWSGSGEALASRYIRGTVELEFDDENLTVGRIDDCSFNETSESEELPDGACGVEAYDFFGLGWKIKLKARFRAGDAMPRIGTIFTIKMPEANQGNLDMRFVVEGEPTVNWTIKGIRSISISGKMHNSMLRSSLVSARLRADGSTSQQSISAFPEEGFGDTPPVEHEYATGLLTSTGVNVTDGKITTVGSTVYRFKNTMAAAYDVQIGTSAANTLANLKMAINAAGVPGTNYYAGTLVHPTVTAGTLTATTLAATANTAGTGGNGIATTDDEATLSWGAATLTGGT